MNVLCPCRGAASVDCYCSSVGPIALTDVLPGDEPDFMQCLESGEVQRTTGRIPHPYLQSDAEWWVNFNITGAAERGRTYNFAIRLQTAQQNVIGIIGINEINSRVAEIGYWIAPLYWGRGIMPSCISSFTRFIKDRRVEYGVDALEAHVFEGNDRSGRALQKAGFSFIERLPDFYMIREVKLTALRYRLDIASPC